ncbi:Retrovirus-related Pol polyprotein from transposon TNT 1-94 [Sesamum angolense]|uniref:Retrovirus-related Pol polyprotein from transposon TNT 1-94 n=1 Tax=Sesamum angolense TaxID=2727404 RepID=A0AAE2C2F4_9LAMI|nr:Retrovirus-related Pol polyprotein from transposon TNT 1-94 [Sesamum angolense]
MAGYNLQPFDGKTDFSIWQQKMKGILIQQKVFKSIDGNYAKNVSDDKKRDNDEYVKNIEENIDEFTKLVQDIKLTGDKNIDDYTPIVLLNAIPDVYSDVKAAIKYGRDNVSLDTVINGLKKEGLEGRWGKGIMKIMKGSLTVFKAVRKRNLYVCSVNYDILAASVTDFDKTSLWHKRKWKILVENQTGKKLKVLRTDNGLEFCNQSFSNLCDECGIKRHKTNPNTPQQNGVAERMNRTLLEKVRCMLISSGLPKSFWGEALVTAAYLINRSPSVPLNGKIPEFVWTGHAVDISSLRVFGCSAFFHQSVDKLAPRSKKCAFIGYPNGIKGYRLWLRSQPGFKVLISKDVIFNENEMPCLDNSQDKKHANIDITFNKVEDNQQGEEYEEELGTEFPENTNSGGLDDYLLARDRNRREPRIPASCLSIYMSNAGSPHWEALKWLLRYLNSDANRGLMFSKCAKGTPLKNDDDDKTLTLSLDRFSEAVLVQVTSVVVVQPVVVLAWLLVAVRSFSPRVKAP